MRVGLGLLLMLCLTLFGQTPEHPTWSVSTVSLVTTKADAGGDHLLQAQIVDDRSRAAFTISTKTFIKKVREKVVIGGTAVILGETPGPDEVVFMNVESRAVSRALAYDARILNRRWLVSTEYYPNHLFPPQYPNDVILVRDLTASKVENRTQAKDATALELSGMVREAGSPVFPEGNARGCSYKNVQEGNDDTTLVYPDTLLLIGESQLAFIASHGKEGSVNEQTLVVLALGEHCGTNGNIRTRDLAEVVNRLKLQRGESLQVARLEQDEPGFVRLVFARGAYIVPDLTIALP